MTLFRPTTSDFVDNVFKHFDAEFFARTAGSGSESRRPVFIFGLPRSGTSLIEQVLASHSRVHGAGELRLGRQSFEAIPQNLGPECSPDGMHLRPRRGIDPPAGRAAPRSAQGAGA